MTSQRQLISSDEYEKATSLHQMHLTQTTWTFVVRDK